MRLLALATPLALALIYGGTVQAGQPGPGDRPQEGKLKTGEAAPEFSLKSPDGKTTFTLADQKGKKPVVLIFGSFT